MLQLFSSEGLLRYRLKVLSMMCEGNELRLNVSESLIKSFLKLEEVLLIL